MKVQAPPREPTEEMIAAAICYLPARLSSEQWAQAWRIMLDKAPAAPSGGSADERRQLIGALRPFVADFDRQSDPGTSDLDNEQPMNIRVSLGDCRRARLALALTKESR